MKYNSISCSKGRNLFLVFVLSFNLNLKSQNIQAISKPKVLVELFTSQGCSSCPPAHSITDKVKADYLNSDEFLILNFHVDYWDNLGWKDPFSSKLYTNRQQMYQQSFGEEGLYTPQFVVMGESGFSGNNEPRLRRELKPFLNATKVESMYEVSALYKEQGKLIFKYNTVTHIDSVEFNAAIISESDTTFIEAGENKGRNLRSHNNVIKFVSIPFRKEGGKAYLNTSGLLNGKSYLLVTWLQNRSSNKVFDVRVYDIN